jgi:D-proline reductase (dithiol) PrdB
MTVDSFKFLPRLISTFYRMTEREPEYPVPWTPLPGKLPDLKFSLITSGGLYMQDSQSPFDVDRERQEPTWGDPTFRVIPADVKQEQIAVSHLHYNTADVLEDLNILLPAHRFEELAREGVIGGLSSHLFSFMGYQGYPPDAEAWKNQSGPSVAGKLAEEEVQCVLLTPA